MGVVLPLWAWCFLCSSVITSGHVVFLCLLAWFYLCVLGFISVGEFITSEGVFCHSGRGFTFVGVRVTSEGEIYFCARGFSSVGVDLPL